MIQVRASCYRKTCRPWCSCCCHNWTPLASCIFWNMHDSIRLLLSSGASRLVRTKEGDTLLHSAARYGDVETLGLLADKGTLGDVDLEARNGVGRTAREIAEARKSDEGEG